MGLSKLVEFVGLLWCMLLSIGANDNINAVEYATLCKFFRFATDYTVSDAFPTTTKAERIVEDVVKFDVLLTLNETEFGLKKESLSDEERRRHMSLPRTLLRMASARKAAKAVEEAKAVVADIKAAGVKFKQFQQDAKNQMVTAIYGGDGNKTLDQAGVTTNKAQILATLSDSDNVCGKTSEGIAGKTLINDMMCLCAGRQNTDGYYCTRKFQHASGTDWGTNVANNLGAHWKTLSEACLNLPIPVTSGTLNHLVQFFFNLLGRQAGTAGTKADSGEVGHYILGRAKVTATDCTGAQHQVCVNYKTALASGGIKWLTKFQEAANSLQSAQDQLAEASGLLHKLENIRGRAAEYWVDANEQPADSNSISQTQSQEKNQSDMQTTRQTEYLKSVAGEPGYITGVLPSIAIFISL